MTKPLPPRHPLRLLLDFDAQAQRDSQQTADFLHRRDRKFALNCEAQGRASDVRHWLAWLRRFDSPGQTVASTSTALQQRWRQINAGFIALGALLGILTMASLLFYDGGQRINITVIIGFAGLQLLLALLTSAQSVLGWQPWRPLLNHFVKAPGPALQQLQPTLMAQAAHGGGLSFAIGALLTLLALVVVQDLAFGWSTTLNTAASGYHRLTSALSVPWAWLWPAAVPDLALIEATRFFRADTAVALAPARWGQWWPFVTMLWLVWVVLPRLLLRALASALIAVRARQLLARHPDLQALHERMATPVLDTGAGHSDADDLPDIRHNTLLQPVPAQARLLSWAGASDQAPSDALAHLNGSQPVLQVGGLSSLSQDQQVLEQLAASGTAVNTVLLVRSWEPPTGELLDFLQSAHQRWPAGSGVCLLPLAVDASTVERQLQPWLRFAERCPRGFVTVGDTAVPAAEASA